MPTTTRPMSAEELLRLPQDGYRYELINGELIKMAPPGSEHGGTVTTLAILVGQHVRSNHLGRVLTGDTGFKLTSNPDTVLAPDVAFVRQERIPKQGLPKEYFPGPPDLAIEVVSPNDSRKEVEEKAQRWLAAGTRMIWSVDPGARTVVVHRPQSKSAKLIAGQILQGNDVVPGFSCRVSELFGS